MQRHLYETTIINLIGNSTIVESCHHGSRKPCRDSRTKTILLKCYSNQIIIKKISEKTLKSLNKLVQKVSKFSSLQKFNEIKKNQWHQLESLCGKKNPTLQLLVTCITLVR